MTQPRDPFEERLGAELKRLYQGPVARADDDAVLSAARSAGEAAVRGGGRWKWHVGLGMAAAVAIAAGVMWSQLYGPREPAQTHAPEPSAPAAAMPGRTGDIRDAYLVARSLKEGKALGQMWDSNGDGVVDQKDVQALAVAAVRLPAEKGEVR